MPSFDFSIFPLFLRRIAYPTLGLLAVLTGCGAPPDAGRPGSDSVGLPDALGSSGVGARDGYTFTDDADPAIAALDFVPTELLVETMPGADLADLNRAFADAGATVLTVMPAIETTVLQVEAGQLFPTAAKLADEPSIESLQKNYFYEAQRVPDDERFPAQDHLRIVRLPEAWEITTGSPHVPIAVLDTGFLDAHPDLVLLPGWNTFNEGPDTRETSGHGTAVAGIVAAESNNGLGITGVSWESPLLPVRVTNSSGQATSRAIARGLLWATQHNARVMNVSFAPLHSDRTVLRAAARARANGGLVFISAGNDARRSPAPENVHAVFVGATDDTDRPAWFSSYGPFVDLVAPGLAILTTSSAGGYETVSGTSHANPVVAGVAALVWAVRPELRPTTVEALLGETAVDLGAAGRDERYGLGRVDAAAAVAAAREVVEDDDGTAPLLNISRPRDGERVTGTIRVLTWTSDAGGVADVVLSIDGGPAATDTLGPFRFAVNTSRLSAGTHTLTCVATDTAGNESQPASVRIVVGSGSLTGGGDTDGIAPEVVINFPVDGTQVADSVGLQATATDNAGLAKADWRIDGLTRSTETLSGTRAITHFTWIAVGAAPGLHSVSVRITDSAGNRASASVSLIKQ